MLLLLVRVLRRWSGPKHDISQADISLQDPSMAEESRPKQNVVWKSAAGEQNTDERR